MNPTEVLLRGHEITRRWGGLLALDWDLAAQPAPDYEVDQRVNW